jgi:hypothetical protein
VAVPVFIEHSLSAKNILHGTAQRQAENKIRAENRLPEVPTVKKAVGWKIKRMSRVEKDNFNCS